LEAYPTCREIIQRGGWINFLEKFQGHNDRVTLAFVESFDGASENIGGLLIPVSDYSIAITT
jgi:hypothetical protein